MARSAGSDLTHDHGQRQAGGHPGHHRRGQAVPRLPPRGATHPRRIPHHHSPTHAIGLHPGDVQTFMGRLVRFLVTSPLRRASELQNLSAYDFFVGRDAPRDPPLFSYSPRFNAVLLEMPRVLAAFDTRWGMPAPTSQPIYSSSCRWIAATTRPTGCSTVPLPNRGSTTGTATSSSSESVSSTVRSTASIRRSRPASAAPPQTPGTSDARRRHAGGSGLHGRRRRRARGRKDHDAAAHGRHRRRRRRTGRLRHLCPSTRRSAAARGDASSDRRDPYAMDEMGKVPWDRFQTLGGIQYYFDTEFQLLRGHMYYSGLSGHCRRSTSTACGRSDRSSTATATSRCSRSISGISIPLPAT